MDEYTRNLPAVIGIKEVMEVLKIGRDSAYSLVNQKGFPKLPIKKPIRIPKDEFLRWAKII